MNVVFFMHILKFHAVSRTHQGRQREPSVETLRSPLSAEFWRHLRFASTPERRNENINLSKYFISSSGDRTHNQSVLLRAAAPRLASNNWKYLFIFLSLQLHARCILHMKCRPLQHSVKTLYS